MNFSLTETYELAICHKSYAEQAVVVPKKVYEITINCKSADKVLEIAYDA